MTRALALLALLMPVTLHALSPPMPLATATVSAMPATPKKLRAMRAPKRFCRTVRCDIRRAMALTHTPRSWLSALLWLAWRESSDNPRAIAYEGTAGGYAEGLMQMLPSTFAAHALPGRTDIWNATDNAAAAIEYIRSRYGYPWAIPGLETQSYGGY